MNLGIISSQITALPKTANLYVSIDVIISRRNLKLTNMDTDTVSIYADKHLNPPTTLRGTVAPDATVSIANVQVGDTWYFYATAAGKTPSDVNYRIISEGGTID